MTRNRRCEVDEPSDADVAFLLDSIRVADPAAPTAG
jgi:hypothetical protein